MDRLEMKLGVRRSASATVILPIAGMLGGLFVGMGRAWYLGLRELSPLECVIRWGVTGFFAGLGLVLLLAVQFRREDLISIRRLMVLIAVAAFIAWFFGRVLFGAIGFQGF
jgi:hypothetical protein